LDGEKVILKGQVLAVATSRLVCTSLGKARLHDD
jgi:hypothetical protein